MTQLNTSPNSLSLHVKVTLWQQISLLLALLINAMAHGYFAIVFPILGREFSLEQWHISIILSLSAGSMILFTPLWGRLCDKFGRRKVFLTGIGSSSISCFALVYCFSNNSFASVTIFWIFSVFLSIRVFHSVFTAGIHPSAQAILAETSEKNKRANVMAFMGASFGLGTILGGALAMFTGANNVSIGFSIIFVLLIISLGITYKFLPETSPQLLEKMPFKIDIKIFLPMLLTTLFIISIYSALQPLTAWRMQDEFLLNPEAAIKFTGAIMMSSMLAMILAQSFIVPLVKWSNTRLRIVGYIISAIAMLFATMANAPILLLYCMVGFGIGVGVLIPGNLAAISINSSPLHQARIAGVNGVFKGAGMALGPIVGNALYVLNNVAFYWGAVLILIILFIFSKHSFMSQE